MSQLFSAFPLRGVTFKNRVVVSPMSQYRAIDGLANNWHLVHLGRFALGGAGLVFCEATAVQARGRRTHGDLGLWNDEQVESLLPVTKFLSDEGSVPGIQLAHAGRKASERRPWHTESPLTDEDQALRGEAPWDCIAPSVSAYADEWPDPVEMTESDIASVLSAFGEAAKRALVAGFRVIEVYAAHGFLIHQFLSPLTNFRQDAWGGDLKARQRFAIEVARSIRSHWPEELPLIFRISATDWIDGGIEIEDSIELARALKEEGVDMIDCSSGGIGGRERPRRMKISQGFQTTFAQQIRREARIPTMAVGFLWDPVLCEALIEDEQADMLALARELLDNPNWTLHAATSLGAGQDFSLWPPEAGWWLMKRDRILKKLRLR